MDLVIVGSIGIDDIKTPFGEKKDILGGSAVYASYAASFFAQPGMVSIKGTDLADEELEFLKKKEISLEGISTKGKNFRWSGSYEFDMNEAKTLKTEINSLADFDPTVPDSYKDAKYIFLANTDPDVQIKVIEEMKNPELIVLDTMNFWIESKKEKLLEAIKKSHVLIFNEGEAKQLFDTPNLIKAGKEALKLGLKAVIIKKGEHGSLLFEEKGLFNCPGYPLEELKDPTGCGDTFGGAFIGYYAKAKDIRKAMVYGSVLASFNAEDFGLNNLRKITQKDIDERFEEMKSLRSF
ncbi:sugar kinase [Candidatus Woesearchaeota archaeon]|nr:sugar kinase [Candidatus Woesearchaeota archaeon]